MTGPSQREEGLDGDPAKGNREDAGKCVADESTETSTEWCIEERMDKSTDGGIDGSTMEAPIRVSAGTEHIE